MKKRVAVGADHAGFPLKKFVIDYLNSQGFEVLDFGTFDEEPTDYPDYAISVGEAIRQGNADMGVVLCGSGVGASVAANKVPGVRAGLCHDTFSARQGREDDDTNVLCMGARVVGQSLAVDILKSFVNAEFSGAPRHVRRLNKVISVEKKYMNESASG